MKAASESTCKYLEIYFLSHSIANVTHLCSLERSFDGTNSNEEPANVNAFTVSIHVGYSFYLNCGLNPSGGRCKLFDVVLVI